MKQKTTTILSAALILLVCSDAFSQANSNKTIERKHLNSWEQSTGYTQTVKVGNTLYLSGLTSEAETMAEQIDEIYSTIQTILKAYGLTTDHIVKETIFTLDIESLKKHAPERKKHYPNGLYPASTWVQVDRLFSPELLLEIEVIALANP